MFQLQRSKTTIIPNKPFTKKIISRKKDGDGRASGEPLNRDLTLASDMAPEVTGSHSLSSGPQEDITELSILLPTQDTSILEIPDLDRRLSAASDVSIVSRPVNDMTSYSAPVSEMKTSDTDNNDMRQR